MTCDKCEKMNYFSRVCSSAPSRKLQTTTSSNSNTQATSEWVDEADDEEYIYALNDDFDFSCGGSGSFN
jgi:hypothetical protein